MLYHEFVAKPRHINVNKILGFQYRLSKQNEGASRCSRPHFITLPRRRIDWPRLLLAALRLALNFGHRRHLVLFKVGLVVALGSVRLLGVWPPHACLCHGSSILSVLASYTQCLQDVPRLSALPQTQFEPLAVAADLGQHALPQDVSLHKAAVLLPGECRARFQPAPLEAGAVVIQHLLP